MTEIAEGAAAPAFTMPASGGRSASSAALQGKPYLLYFYPKADTPGCTTQACGIQEALPQLGKLKLEVIGVSPDPVAKIEKFAAKYGLTFPLAADEDHAVAEAYGVWVEKSMYGKKYMGVARTTYVIAPDGKVALRIDKVRPEGHAEEVIAAIKALTSAACMPSNSASSASTKARSSPRTKAKTPRASTSTPASKRR